MLILKSERIGKRLEEKMNHFSYKISPYGIVISKKKKKIHNTVTVEQLG